VFRIIVLIMVVVPALEIWGLITVGQLIGAWPTFFLIVFTGFLGAFLAKREAKKVWEFARYQMQRGQIPGVSILDGISIFAGGLLLLTPGFFTDLLGFALVLPLTRPFFRNALLLLIRKKIEDGTFRIYRR
jgi:UPF0716 protein FxsA